MKIVLYVFGALFFLAASFGIIQTLASERIEVVELHTNNEEGEEVITRLWIVDHNDSTYLRSGDDQAGWFQRLTSAGQVDVTRNDVRATYKIKLEPEVRAEINTAMRIKYTWGDEFFSTTFGYEGAIPVKLIPMP